MNNKSKALNGLLGALLVLTSVQGVAWGARNPRTVAKRYAARQYEGRTVKISRRPVLVAAQHGSATAFSVSERRNNRWHALDEAVVVHDVGGGWSGMGVAALRAAVEPKLAQLSPVEQRQPATSRRLLIVQLPKRESAPAQSTDRHPWYLRSSSWKTLEAAGSGALAGGDHAYVFRIKPHPTETTARLDIYKGKAFDIAIPPPHRPTEQAAIKMIVPLK